ncbi:response regulator [Peredibacter starrii]|uniref:Response regulator n=1 Tax=Peredibacter starrii TaxID=28202 RepID=A0AAX4HNQ7_9BACT|nr:response regulator [Peredibacter starrii]WPU64801.1 response regulator [Peredibacter starrii]
MEIKQRAVILIVDDQPELLSVMGMYFEHYGYRHFKAASALAALEILEKEKIDLVICDLVMPRIGGLELLKRIRESQSDAPYFIFCSGFCDVPFAQPYPEGVLGFIQKPFTMMDLMDKVAAQLKQLEIT